MQHYTYDNKYSLQYVVLHLSELGMHCGSPASDMRVHRFCGTVSVDAGTAFSTSKVIKHIFQHCKTFFTKFATQATINQDIDGRIYH